jgi:hypothetical protein
VRSIQAILIAACFLAAILWSAAFRSKLVSKLLAAFFFLAATILIVFPDITSNIAHALGVGRGADLLLYIGILAGIHLFLLLYLRIRRLERQMTEQIRALALRDVRYKGVAEF